MALPRNSIDEYIDTEYYNNNNKNTTTETPSTTTKTITTDGEKFVYSLLYSECQYTAVSVWLLNESYDS